MNKRLLLRLWAFSIGVALCVFQLADVTAQQEAETPAGQVASPTAPDADEITPDETADSATEENDESVDEVDSAEPEPPSPAEEAFQRAMQHEEENKLDEAIADCTEAIRLDPENLEYLITRAELYGEMRNLDQALADSAKILEKDPNNLRAFVLRGKTFELSGDAEKARTEFNQAVEHNPTDWHAFFERQNYYERQGEHDKAVADADRMIQLEPNLAAGYLSRALSHAATGEWDQATNYSSMLLQGNAENWVAYTMRASARSARGDDAGAEEDIEAALRLAPDNPFVLNARGTIYLVKGDYEKSLADLEKAAQLQPRNSGFKAILADFFATCPDEHLRNAQKAAEYAKDAQRLEPNNPAVLRACASAAAANGNFDEAVKWEERLLASKGTSPDRKSSGEARLEAYKAGKPYLLNFPPAEKVLVLNKVKQGNEAIKNGNFDRAVAALSEAIAADPNEWVPYYGRGFAYFRQEKYELALADLNVAIHFKPEDIDSHSVRGSVLRNLGQYDKALDDYLKAESLDKNDEKRVKNNLAWLLATCPDDRVRDGSKAAGFMDEALQFHADDGPTWDTCAAVFAENGDFDDAIDWEQAYLDRNDVTEEQRRDGGKRLALYQQHQPYRTEPAGKSDNFIAEVTPTPPGK